MIRKELGETAARALVMRIVGEMIMFINVGKSMSEYQIAETSKMILSEFYFLKLEDFQVFFQRFKTGHYGKLFDRLDGQVIMLHLREYVNERNEVAETSSLERHKEFLESQKQEQYIIQVGKNFVRSCGDDFEEVDKKELATAFTYGVAYRIRLWVVKEYYSTTPEQVKMIDKNKAEGSFFDYLEKNAPQLLPKDVAYTRATNEYFELKKAILENDKLNGFEKENAIRALSNIEPLTIEEYNQREFNNQND